MVYLQLLFVAYALKLYLKKKGLQVLNHLRESNGFYQKHFSCRKFLRKFTSVSYWLPRNDSFESNTSLAGSAGPIISVLNIWLVRVCAMKLIRWFLYKIFQNLLTLFVSVCLCTEIGLLIKYLEKSWQLVFTLLSF